MSLHQPDSDFAREQLFMFLSVDVLPKIEYTGNMKFYIMETGIIFANLLLTWRVFITKNHLKIFFYNLFYIQILLKDIQ